MFNSLSHGFTRQDLKAGSFYTLVLSEVQWLTLPDGRRTLRSVLTVATESSLLNMKIF